MTDSRSQPLAGRRILVTRPAAQADNLCALLTAAGATALRFPVLEIVPLPNNPDLAHASAHLAQAALAIFVSKNAVEHSLPSLLAQQTWPAHVLRAAVGLATAASLAAHGLPAQLCPDQDFNSEGLLALPALSATALRGQQVLIFRGTSGRDLLADSLRLRGATVQLVPVYQRRLPLVDWTQHPWADSGGLDAVIVTSGESAANLLQLLPNAAWLKQIPWILISARLTAPVRALGVTAPLHIAPRADDAGLLSALLERP